MEISKKEKIDILIDRISSEQYSVGTGGGSGAMLGVSGTYSKVINPEKLDTLLLELIEKNEK